MTPWLPNMVRFCKQDEGKREREGADSRRQQRVIQILEKLIQLTVQEVEMYPSIQAKIWGTIGQLPELIDMVLDCFMKRCETRDGFLFVEILADTAVALASSKTSLVAKKIIKRLCWVSGCLRLHSHAPELHSVIF